MPNLAAGPVTIGPRRRSVQVVALALTVGLAACGAAKTQTTGPSTPATPPNRRMPTNVRLLTGPHGECPGVMFKIPGRARQDLSARPAFLRNAGHVLGAVLVSK